MSVRVLMRNAFALVGLISLLAGTGLAAFFFAGFYSVAADSADPEIVNWTLVHVRQASIAAHGTERVPGGLEEPATVQAGARAYAQLGCTNCHGGPGVSPARFSEGLNPPPNLKSVINEITPAAMFWVIKNGIKMTGMPSFGSGTTPAEDGTLWSVVAFLKRTPAVSAEDYKSWTAAQ